MSELLKCPFCGGEAEMLNYSPTEWLVHCIECDGMVEKWRKTEQEAIEQWNRRTPMANIVEKLEELPYGRSYHDYAEKGIVHKYLERNDVLDIVKQEINNGLE
jgi:Lar family restriction alleviation protein